ncbi:hypothetical protein HDU88_000315 [Geranomyces variabilis]|nr:hypothetical protein HDU88_000315 [Geranomyces variabilis]
MKRSRPPPPAHADTVHVHFDLPAPEARTADPMVHNPYVDSFPNSSLLSPYGASFPPAQHAHHHLTAANARRGARSSAPRQTLPPRTTKHTQKLVLFPDEGGAAPFPAPPTPGTGEDDHVPWYQGYNEVVVPDVVPDAARTEAERMSKDQRTRLPRVTSYCVAEGYKIAEIAKLARNEHRIAPKKYDECLYVSYDPENQNARFGGPRVGGAVARPIRLPHVAKERVIVRAQPTSSSSPRSPVFMPGSFAEFPDLPKTYDETLLAPPREDNDSETQPAWMMRGEVFIFDYGVIVFWNFTAAEEQAYLNAIQRHAVGILPKGDSENEDFHYQYDMSGPHQPRIFNDMITLKSGNELIKLTISHGLAQSVKLAYFENVMDETIEDTIPLPRAMARYGEVKMRRTDVMKIVGQLFKLRMNVNLISNVLDKPELFWSEPELEGLYDAIRGYLEISQRAKLLNMRAEVVSSLLEMLTDHMNSNEMTYITWIVIALIVGAVVIAAAEVWVKVLRLRAGMED